jgi:hypothetical protein
MNNLSSSKPNDLNQEVMQKYVLETFHHEPEFTRWAR